MFYTLSYLFIYIMLAIFALGFLGKFIKKVQSGQVDLNPIHILSKLIMLEEIRKNDFKSWIWYLFLHVGILFLVSTDTTFGLNTLGPYLGINISFDCLISLARIFCFIGGTFSFIGLIGLMERSFVAKKDLLYSKFSLLFILLVEVFMWTPMILHFDFLGFNSVVKGIVLFSSVEVPLTVMMSTLSGSAFLAYISFTKTTDRYWNVILKV